jgi:streptogramin lyase
MDPLAVYYATKIAGGGLAETIGIDGGAVVELGTGTYVGIAVDTSNVYWTGGAANPFVYQNSKTGTPSSVITIATGSLTCPLAVASDGVNVYFLDQGTSTCGPPGTATGALYRVPVGNTGALPSPLVSGLTDPQGLVVDTTSVYWITGGTSGSVMKLAK